MKKLIQKFVNSFKHADKVLHFIAGALISLVFSLAFNPVAGFCVAMAAGFYKEFCDHKKNGPGGINTWLDWIATILGGAVVSLLF